MAGMKACSPYSKLFVWMLVVWLTASPWLEARVEPTHGFDIFSQEEEIQLGKQNAAEVRKQMPVLPDSDPVSQYVQKLGAKLAARAPGYQWPYSFHVVNVKEINAFALPGGPIFVNLGTIQAADNEAQLAGVMSHELSHVVQRHGTRAASKQMAAQLPLAILGGFMGNSTLARAAEMGISFGVGSYFLKNSRQSESEADLLGTDVMYDSGFEPRQMALFFEKLEKEMGASANSMINQFMSDHPNPGNRAEAVSLEVKTLMPRTYLADSREFPRDQDAGGWDEAADVGAGGGDAEAGRSAHDGGSGGYGYAAERELEGVQSQRISDFVSGKLARIWRPEFECDDRAAKWSVAERGGVWSDRRELPVGGGERVVGYGDA